MPLARSARRGLPAPRSDTIGGHPPIRRVLALAAVALAALAAPVRPTWGAKVILKDGRVLEGKFAKIPSLVERPRPASEDGPVVPRLILLCDDDLRRVFVPERRVAQLLETDSGEVLERFTIRQPVARAGMQVQSVGGMLEITPFDEYGRRRFTMRSGETQVDVVQGLTVITPRWCKLEGISHVWDMRLAPTSIPRETFDAILRRYIDPKSVDDRLKIARMYVQSQRYADAKRELEQIIADFPEVEEQVAAQVRSLAQLGARLVLGEVKSRRDAGQHQTAQFLLAKMPTADVSGEILREAAEIMEGYQAAADRGQSLLARLDESYGLLEDSAVKRQMAPVLEEIRAELNLNTLDRFAAFEQFERDPDLGPAERVSLAVSGWLAGSQAAVNNAAVAASLFELRGLIEKFLTAPDKLARDELLGAIRAQEGSTPEMIARLVQMMKPPLPPLPAADSQQPGQFELPARRLDDEPDTTYLVQLPPEYDPHRYYPAVVTLHGSQSTPEQQLAWWAGEMNEGGQRLGQATRHGFIVIAPAWARDNLYEYDFSASSHAAVLNALRDACRRFSIDTDRVFLSGHFMGGDAAWDIGLAHPDLWAGVIPISAVAERYCKTYWGNARYVPFYVVGGELDGNRPQRNAESLDRYLSRGFNVTVAEFIGRGNESFSDEIIRLFEWMQLQRRDFFPREFTCTTMRRWDNYFWWLELDDLSPRSVLEPSEWPPRNVRAATVEARITAGGDIRVKAPAAAISLWLAPQLVDFNQNVSITINGRRLPRAASGLEPDVTTLLDDVRTRGDRQHPFWLRLNATP